MLPRWFHGYALVRKVEDDSIRWLVLRTSGGGIDLVHGPRLERESFRETATREVTWQLGLNRDSDFLVSTMATLNLEFEAVLPGTCQPHHVAVAFYPVDVYRTAVLQRLDAEPRCLWLNSAELCSGRAPGGEQLHPVTLELINRFEIVQAWQQ
ncbi:MAG: hypothetical protein ACK493_02080 [Planctomycetota bacterium]